MPAWPARVATCRWSEPAVGDDPVDQMVSNLAMLAALATLLAAIGWSARPPVL